MTSHYAQQKQTVYRNVLLSITCDRCQTEVEKPPGYHVRAFELEFSQGEAFPSGGHRDGWKVSDLCDECVEFLERLLKSNGFVLEKVEVFW